MVIDDCRRSVVAVVQVIVVDDAVDIQYLRMMIEARLLVVVERVQVVAGTWQRIFP